MRFDLITLFPEMFAAVRDQGVCGRAHQRGLWALHTWNPRDFTHDVHRTVDDRPFGGGPGMVMMAEPLAQAVQAVRAARQQVGADAVGQEAPVVLLSPVGQTHHQALASRWAGGAGAILVCGRYEGIDQRFIDRYVDLEVSLGDFVLSGGELGAMVLIDSVVRLLPGVLHDAESAQQDSFNPALTGLLDSPHYTRPEVWDGVTTPETLLSGHHVRIAAWRRQQSLTLTAARRPDLIEQARRTGGLSPRDEAVLKDASLLTDSSDRTESAQ
ncbi:tRNA (guanosine(37)-N1)-methyltransferase TrmD [Castellaniella sp.]|uniref:tRNA (guanosine(37)-N1)-methyltransferase TrmD n=1 Tax=Castellaniella sp. TaxID=1955812 RepID=UPI002AFDE5D1|nr:tRNA (guanosine(37)-N1)-methyltransferase TrmD [Castellaniella sp.]